MKVIFFINLLLPFLVNSYTVRNPIKANHGGIELGIATLSTGILMDNTIAKKSLIKLKENSNQLYNDGMKEVIKNLIVLGPLYHYGLEKIIIFDYTSSINLLETFEIVFIHSLGYYSAHKLMHKSDFFRD